MDEFLGLAIWILMAFLMVNASIMWFQSSDTFINNGLNGVGATTQTIVDYNGLQPDSSGSTATSEENQFPPGNLSDTFGLVTGAIGWFWNLLTAWVSVIFLITSELGEIGVLMQVVLIPFFALTEVFAIMVLAMKIAGIIRGGS
jgi:hypothetical protein